MKKKVVKKESMFLPNAFQTPNAYVDEVMPYLTGEEYKVLIYAVRRILGFQKRQDRISISQFTNGTVHTDGYILDEGTGLGIGTVKKCLANLVDFGLMVRLGENDPRTNEGTLWSLQWNDDEVNWQALQERLEKWDKVNADRIAKARSVRQTPVCGTELSPASGTESGGSSGTETQKTELEIHRNTDNKDSLFEVISSIADSIFTDIQVWWTVRGVLNREDVTITGDVGKRPNLDDPMKIVISGLSEKPKGGQFTLAEIWEHRFTKSFSNLGVDISFQE
jgi:hypothetical protein